MRVCINPASLMEPRGAYSQIVRDGGLVFLAGMVPRDKSGELIGSDITAQTRAVLANVRLAMEAVGGSMRDICSVTTYLADFERDFGEYNSEFSVAFPEMPPARTTIGAGLRGILIEVQCMAVLRSPADSDPRSQRREQAAEGIDAPIA